jgi:hypothetical protein
MIQASTEVGMKKSVQIAPWVVYQMIVQGQPGPKVVCCQHEWDAIEKATPGHHRLIKDGILNEGEAELLARGTSGAAKVRISKKLIAELLDTEPDLIVESEGEEGIKEGQEDVDLPHMLFPTLAKETGELGVNDELTARVGTGPDGEVA